MNFVFKSSPAHPWFSGWILEPRDCTSVFHEKKHDSFFQTLPEVGVVGPCREDPEWSLQLFFPPQITTHLLFNGICGYQIKRKSQASVEMFVPEPGVLWGRSFNLLTPKLLTKNKVKQIDGFDWMESDELSVLFAERDGIFCLISKTHRFEDAVRLAEKYFEQDLEAHLIRECDARKGSCQLFEQFNRYDALAMLCSETMMRAIRPPEGNVLSRWSQSKGEKIQLNVNEIPALVMAWKYLNPNVAQDLLLGVLRLQNNAGALPVCYAPHQTFSLLESPKPMLARSTEMVWETAQDQDFLTEVIPLLRRYIQWLLHHFDPKRKGTYCWQNKNECLDSNKYESECATVDLLALLLSEIRALNRLQTHLPGASGEDLFFEEERTHLEEVLQSQFWNKKDGRFNKAYIRDKKIEVEGFPEFLPLLLRDLSEAQQSGVLNRLYESNLLPGAGEMLSWRVMSPDQTSFPLLQQFLLLDILETHDSKGTQARDFTRLLLQGFMEWHTTALNKNQSMDLDPAMAAFIITLMATHHYRDRKHTMTTHIFGKIQQKLKISRFDMAVVGVAVFTLLASHFIYDHINQKPPFNTLNGYMNAAFLDQDVKAMVENAQLIQKYYPEKAAKAEFLMANLALMHGELNVAEALFLKVREKAPDSPAPMIFLGIIYQKKGEFEKANKVYDEFTFLFDEIFPAIVERIIGYQYLMEEGFKSPPRWKELYQYKAMNELEPSNEELL